MMILNSAPPAWLYFLVAGFVILCLLLGLAILPPKKTRLSPLAPVKISTPAPVSVISMTAGSERWLVPE